MKIENLLNLDCLDSESDEDDDNITVTVPPAHQQSRGANFRDTRVRRVQSHGVEQFPHSSKNQPDESESFEEESNSSVRPSRDRDSKRTNSSSYEQPPQGISTLSGSDDKTMYHSSSSHEYQHPQQQQQVYNPGMMSQMHQHSMYPQGPYHQQQQPYYPPNQMR